MRVGITTADNQAVGAYRVRWPAEAAAAQGLVEIELIDLNMDGREIAGEKRVTNVSVPEVDVLVLQRPTNRFLAQAIPLYQKAGVAVVVELDDDLQRTADKHSQRKVYDPCINPDENWRHLKAACLVADLVVVSTPDLRRYAPHGRVEVVRNYVPERYLDIPRADDGLTVGWGGTVLNHPGDLPVTYGGVAAAMREVPGSHFLVVGDGEHVREQLSLDDEPEKTGFVSIDDYPQHVARFTVGIAPLEDSRFNAAKTALKGIEYAALGIPFVASNSNPQYQELYETGVGCALVPDRGRNWRSAVLHYLRSESNRDAASSMSCHAVREHWTIEKNAWRFAEVWELAVQNRRFAR